MKGVPTILMFLLAAAVAVLGYYNFSQHKTIQLLNDEIFEQARLRHNLILKKHVLEQQLEKFEMDTSSIEEKILQRNPE